jgi:hypothetical protein
MFSLKKINIDSIIGDDNNTRKITNNEQDLLMLSLKKLGLLSPLFINKKGMLLSGHQRTRILKKLGAEYIYCYVIDTSNYDRSRLNAINVIFNRELQEIGNIDVVYSEEEKNNLINNLYSELNKLPDKENLMQPLDDIEYLKVTDIKCKDISLGTLFNNSRSLYKLTKGAIIPIVIDDNNNIINGVGRYTLYKDKFNYIPCVRVKGVPDNLFRLISASYSLKGKEDVIRTEQRRHYIEWCESKVFLNLLFGIKKTISLSFLHNRLKEEYNRILDFGSGNGKQTVTHRFYKKVDVVLFEPFATAGVVGKFSMRETYNSINKFLDEYKRDSIFPLVRANAVLNSVPFYSDRVKIEILLKFLSCGSKALAFSVRNGSIHKEKEGSFRNTMVLKEYGDNTIISNNYKVKMQKLHTLGEVLSVFEVDGNTVEYAGTSGKYIHCVIRNPKYHIDKEELLEAVRFEFGLKYDGRVFEDLCERAVSLFSLKYDNYKRIGLIL